MSLLLDDAPTSIIDIDGTLYFNTEQITYEDSMYEGECKTYHIKTGYRDIIDILLMYETSKLNDNDKAECMLRMFYIDRIPDDTLQAFAKAMEFLNCDKETTKNKRQGKDYGRLFSWEQDGNYIYSSINYSHNEILKHEHNLHWWEFMSKFMQLKEDCKFNDILNNRLAHKKGKATNEQKIARKEYPEIYVLKADRGIENKVAKQIKDFERKLNN